MTTNSYTEVMPAERESDSPYLTAIHIDLKERSIVLEAGQTATRLTVTPEGIRYELLGFAPTITERSVDKLAAEPAEPGEKRSAVTLTGRLKTKPKEGRPDGKGNPTAWARLAAHVEDEDTPHLYSCTFHRHTARIALGLEKEAQITVAGYVHQASDPKRLDTLSVYNVINYPGKGKEDQG